MTVTHHTGHVLDHIRQLPDNSVDLVATSPPFLALRDYNGLPDQWGSEPTPAAFLAHLLELTTELRRVLTPHGSIAIELGDTFAGSGGAGGDYTAERARDGQPRFDGSAKASRGTMKNDRVQGEGHAAPIRNLNGKQGPSGPGWPGAKSLCGTPTLFAWSLAYGRTSTSRAGGRTRASCSEIGSADQPTQAAQACLRRSAAPVVCHAVSSACTTSSSCSSSATWTIAIAARSSASSRRDLNRRSSSSERPAPSGRGDQ